MIRSVVSDADVAKTIELREAVDPLTATTVGDQRVFRAQASGWLQLLAADAGYGFAARFPDESTPVADVGVVPGRRGRGIGRALFAAVSAHARERGWDVLQMTASDPDGVEWLGRRGVARALKEELIGRSRAEGLARLITQSNEANVAMRSLNEALGYRPAPPLVVFRGTPA